MVSRIGRAALILLGLASSIHPAFGPSSFMSTVAVDSDTPNTSLAILGAQKLIEDSHGKRLAVYVDSPGDRLAVAVANGEVTSSGWTTFRSAAPKSGYKHPSAVLVSDDNLRIIAERGIAPGYVVEVVATLARDGAENIVGITFQVPKAIDSSGTGRNPNAILAHDGSIILVWSQNMTGTFSQIRSLRWTETDGWTSLPNTSSTTPDTPILDTGDFGLIFPGLIEREDNKNIILVGNRSNSTATNLVFNKASYNGQTWTWGQQNLAFENNAAKGQQNAPSLAWDPAQHLVVVAYDFAPTSTHKYEVFTLDASNNKVHHDTPVLTVTNADWGTISVDETTGEYYLFMINADFDGGGGPVGYTRFVAGSWNPSLTIIDSSDNQGVSIKKSTSPGLEILFMTGRGNPSTLKFTRLSFSSIVTAIEIFTSPNPSFVGEPATVSGILSTGGSGIAEKRVELQQSYDNVSWNSVATSTTDIDGSFSFEITFLSSNKYFLRAVFFSDSFYLGSSSDPVAYQVLPPDSTPRFSFAVGGDLDATVATTSSLDALATSDAHFFLAVGDLSYGTITPEAAWCDYVKLHVGDTFPFELLSGNHESGNEETDGGLIDNFVTCLPDNIGAISGTYGKEYYFDYPNTSPLARIIMISPALNFTDGGFYEYRVGNAHYGWLSSAIDSARATGIPWVFVAMHKNCLSIGIFPCALGPDLVDLLINKKVDLVLEGHEHTYQRSKQLSCATPNQYSPGCVVDDGSDGRYMKGAGTVFVISGMFGSNLFPINATDNDAGYFANAFGSNTLGNGHGFVKFTVHPDKIDGELVLASGGPFIDSFHINAISVSIIPPRPWAGTSTSFLSSTIGGTAPYTIIWDLNGDGIVDAQGSPVSRTYNAPQIITISVFTRDANGATSQLSFVITVLPFPPAQFKFDWADYTNNGVVNIFDIATAAPCFLENSNSINWATCAYWDFNLNDRIDIGDIATAAFQYGVTVPAPYPGQGEAVGTIDDSWLPYCSGLAPAERAYCDAL